MQRLEAQEKPLAKIFCGDYDFRVPNYQRPYAWGKEQAAELLDDLSEALDRDEGEPYFLGSLVLIKQPERPEADIVDGQQRLTTLTILFAILADLAPDQTTAVRFRALIVEPGDVLLGRVAKPRLELRSKDTDFFQKYVQSGRHLDDLLELSENELDTGAQKAIQTNVGLLRDRLYKWTPEQRLELGMLLAQRTYLVVVSTGDLESAHRIFTVLNTRGMDLSPADVFKSEVIGDIAEEARDDYARKWEDAEDDLGRADFADLFLHIRMIYDKKRARQELLKEFPDQVLSHFKPGKMKAFIDDELVPYARAYCEIRDAGYGLPELGGENVNAWFRRLVQLDNNDWWPAALWALRHHRGDPKFLNEFFARLERLSASMFIRRVYTTPRVDRYTRLLSELSEGVGLDASSFDLDADEVARTVAVLDGDLYLETKVRRYVLLRLDELLSAEGGPTFHPKLVTIEHVLPQHPLAESEWCGAFTAEQRGQWTHRLANLVLLNRNKNAAAARYDFTTKKEKYFTGHGGVAIFALTVEVLNTSEWIPEVVEVRQERLLNELTNAWYLDVASS